MMDGCDCWGWERSDKVATLTLHNGVRSSIVPAWYEGADVEATRVQAVTALKRRWDRLLQEVCGPEAPPFTPAARARRSSEEEVLSPLSHKNLTPKRVQPPLLNLPSTALLKIMSCLSAESLRALAAAAADL